MTTRVPRSGPRPGSLPLPEDDEAPPDPRIEEIRQAGMPFLAKKMENRTRRKQSPIETAITGLKQAREEVQTQAGWVEDLIFDDWIARCVVEANDPREWTQAHALYEDYLAHAKKYGSNRAQKSLLVEVLATETQWGRWMATRFPKKRRTTGWFYPLRRKRG